MSVAVTMIGTNFDFIVSSVLQIVRLVSRLLPDNTRVAGEILFCWKVLLVWDFATPRGWAHGGATKRAIDQASAVW